MIIRTMDDIYPEEWIPDELEEPEASQEEIDAIEHAYQALRRGSLS